MAGDIISVEDDDPSGKRLLQLVMRAGQRVQPSPTLVEIRAHAACELGCLPDPLRRLDPGASYPLEVADALALLAA
jgi:nicotinate phosphoribosyltransferase